MQPIQIVLDKKLLQAADEAARRTGQNRSALFREAMRDHLLRLDARAREARDREGYEKAPQRGEQWDAWEGEAEWPAD